MIDIIGASTDLELYNTNTERAKNILSVQLRSLTYAPDLGIDLAYFLSEDFTFQNESFKNYCVQVLANQGINVSSVDEIIDALASNFNFNIKPEENNGTLIAR